MLIKTKKCSSPLFACAAIASFCLPTTIAQAEQYTSRSFESTALFEDGPYDAANVRILISSVTFGFSGEELFVNERFTSLPITDGPGPTLVAEPGSDGFDDFVAELTDGETDYLRIPLSGYAGTGRGTVAGDRWSEPEAFTTLTDTDFAGLDPIVKIELIINDLEFDYSDTGPDGSDEGPVYDGSVRARIRITTDPTAPTLPGDTDNDGDVDDADLGIAFSNYTGPLDGADKTAAQGDIDSDGDVDDADLGIAFSNYTGPQASAVPEPLTGLALIGTPLLAWRRRRA